MMTSTTTLTKRIVSAILALVLVVAFIPVFAAPAQAREVAHGTYGECAWSIDDSGLLTISPKSGEGRLGDIDGLAPWRVHADNITSARILAGVKGATSLDGLFANCDKLRSVDLSGLDSSNTRGMSALFDGCSALTTIDVSGLNTSSATTMTGMFRGCVALESIDVSNFNTANVTNMSYMFSSCAKLTDLDLTNFNTERVTNMQRMFSDAGIKYLDLSRFDTSSLEDMWGMFYGCTSLGVLDISGFDTANVTSMGYLFEECDALERVKLGAKFAFVDESCELPQVTWLSSVAGRSYTANQIATQRKNVADTYVKSRPEYPGPTIVSGAEAIWGIGLKTGAMFRSSASIEDFVCVKVDGNVVLPENYDLKGNQTNVTFAPGYLVGLSIGEHALDIMSATGTASTTFTVSDDPAYSEPINMYRLYNPNSGEHFYTASEVERDHLVSVGWTYERVGWVAPSGGEPVYRLYNPNAGEHHYTVSVEERDQLISVGWNDEGIGWRTAGTVPLYRQYNPNAYANNHNYTTSEVERDHLLGLGWKDEGIGWYGIGE